MKKLLLTMLPSVLAVAGFAQTTNTKSNTVQPTTKLKTVSKTNHSASTLQANTTNTAATTAQNTGMTRLKLKHTSQQKIIK